MTTLRRTTGVHDDILVSVPLTWHEAKFVLALLVLPSNNRIASSLRDKMQRVVDKIEKQQSNSIE